MRKDRLIELLIKEEESVLSGPEKEELTQWIQQSDQNAAEVTQIKKSWKNATQLTADFSIDMEKDYAKVLERIHAKKKQGIVRLILPLAATFLLLVGLWFVYSVYFQNPVKYYSGSTQSLQLPDGSILDLKENSEFAYQASNKNRGGRLTGSGYFDIKSDQERPFIISTKIGNIIVTGTQFSIDEGSTDQVIVRVEEGTVMVTNQQDQTVTLQAGEEGVMTEETVRKHALDQPAGFWRLTPIQYQETPFGEIQTQIENLYHIQLQLSDPDIAACLVDFTLSYPKLDDLFAILETVLNVSIEKTEETKYIVRGSGCS
ncbi:MAG: FecR family protein [Saprospiraceae bacterium]|nr:FecR family protein [Saprospiraceae bacterium]